MSKEMKKGMEKFEISEEALESVSGGNFVADVWNTIDDTVIKTARDVAISEIESSPVGKIVMNVADIIK